MNSNQLGALPGVVPIHDAVRALDFFVFDKPEVGLAYSKCPMGDHVLRVKGVSTELVDVFCEGGCQPTDLVDWITAAAQRETA